MKTVCLLLILFLSSCNVKAYASDIITPTKVSFLPGEKISVNLSNAPFNNDEWVGIYSLPNNKLISWRYTGGIETGTIEFGETDEGTQPLGYGSMPVSGQYIVRLFSSVSPIEVGSAIFTVSTQDVFLSPGKEAFYQDEELTINYSNAPSSNRNWIGLYHKNESSNRNFIRWSYTTNGESNGVVTLKKGVLAGDYDIRFFSNNSFKLEGQADIKIIARKQVKVELSKNDYKLGESISVRFMDAPEKNKDWVGIFIRDEPNNKNILRWVYTGGKENGQVMLQGINLPGKYEARFFANNSFKMEARVEFTILSEDIKQVTVALLSDISWIEPQVYEKNINPPPRPSTLIQNISIKSKKEIIKAYDAITKQSLPVIYSEGTYKVDIPPFEFSKFININYINNEANEFSLNNSNRSENSRINGYTALSTGYYFKPYKWGDAFSNAENKMKEFGFTIYKNG